MGNYKNFSELYEIINLCTNLRSGLSQPFNDNTTKYNISYYYDEIKIVFKDENNNIIIDISISTIPNSSTTELHKIKYSGMETVIVQEVQEFIKFDFDARCSKREIKLENIENCELIINKNTTPEELFSLSTVYSHPILQYNLTDFNEMLVFSESLTTNSNLYRMVLIINDSFFEKDNRKQFINLTKDKLKEHK